MPLSGHQKHLWRRAFTQLVINVLLHRYLWSPTIGWINSCTRIQDPEFAALNAVLAKTVSLCTKLNHSGNIATVRALLSKIISQFIDESTTIYTNFGRFIQLGKPIYINHGWWFLYLGGPCTDWTYMVRLITEHHLQEASQRTDLLTKPLLIKKNAWIGAEAAILPGVTIGEKPSRRNKIRTRKYHRRECPRSLHQKDHLKIPTSSSRSASPWNLDGREKVNALPTLAQTSTLNVAQKHADSAPAPYYQELNTPQPANADRKLPYKKAAHDRPPIPNQRPPKDSD